MTPPWFSRANLIRLCLPAAVVLLCIALLAPPIQRERPLHRYVLTFDISQSMNVEDVQSDSGPISRLDQAKAAARALVGGLPCGSQVGWGIFAGARTVTLIAPVEVCEHYSGLLSALDELDGRMRFENASSVGKALHQSLRAASALGEGTAVVLLSDGHEAPPLGEGQRGIPKSEELGVPGFVVGVGGDVPVRIPKTDVLGRSLGYWQSEDVIQSTVAGGSGREELSSLREPHLQALARYSGLDYLRLSNTESFVTTLNEAGFARQQRVAMNSQWIPAALALLLISLRFVLTTFAAEPRRSVSARQDLPAGQPEY